MGIMETKLTNYEKTIVGIIMVAIAISDIGIVYSCIVYNKSLLYFSLLNFIGWFIVGMLLLFFNVKVFKK